MERVGFTILENHNASVSCFLNWEAYQNYDLVHKTEFYLIFF